MDTRITKLTLQGFKSFKKRVSIPLLSGFNIICGPNGSGKTNLLDAVCFALGRTSMKSLRAGRLHELIYHGGENNAGSNSASVTLWFDNSARSFPFDSEEVAIKRKINRRGASLYKINGRTVTREKVLDLLSSARIHPDGFNIIMQGDVAQVIEMTPQERREIIDDISGIRQYSEKKEKAQNNLKKVEEKLKEVEIILSERMERLQELEQDRNTALKYKDLTRNLEILKASLAYKKFQLLNEEYEETGEKVRTSEEEVLELENGIRELEQEMEELEKRKEEIADKMFVRSKKISVREEIEEIKNKILRNKNRIEINLKEIERLDRTIERLESIKERKTGVFSRGVQSILNLGRSGVHNAVGNLINVPKEYETAVEVAGGYKLQNLVVDNSLIATECINFLKRERLGRATFLPLNRIRGRRLRPDQQIILKKPGVIGLITDLIKHDRKYSPAIEHVFGDTIVVENLGVARNIGIGKVRMVTLDGDLAERSGAMIGGYYQKKELIGEDLEIREYEQRKTDLEEENNFLDIEISQLRENIEKLEKSQEREVEEVSELEKERSGIEERLENARQERKEKFEQRLILQNKVNKLKIKAARMEAELQTFKIEVEKYGEVEYVDERSEILELRISDSIKELNSLGLVNMKAIEEYEEFKGEFNKLKEKYDRITDEKKAIQDMIEKIDTKRKEVFYETLRGVDRNFSQIFKKIARGKASLELEDPLDIESGLLIQANPKGKNMLNIDAMSGGEKSLTALAFLFGVQKFKPAPFYILDEVDAFLDKVNTKNIVNMIKELSRKEQFIVITHNDYTIKQGDRVYGVSMEKNESKILGLELPEMKVDENERTRIATDGN